MTKTYKHKKLGWIVSPKLGNYLLENKSNVAEFVVLPKELIENSLDREEVEKDWDGEFTEYIEPVVFKNGNFTPRDESSLPDDGYYGWRSRDIEVIGNIYENPDFIT